MLNGDPQLQTMVVIMSWEWGHPAPTVMVEEQFL
jgi:hypothetical protein